MLKKTPLIVLLVLCLHCAVSAKQAAGPVNLRVILHDPVNPMAELYLPDQNGELVALNVVPNGMSETQLTLPAKGSLVIYKTAAVNPENPTESLASSAKIPANVKQMIAILTPVGSKSKMAYRMVLIDDSKRSFPYGESRILSLVPVETAVEAGEHKIQLKSGVVTRLPLVKKASQYNMAQTNFYYKEGKSWVPFTERQLQYLDEFRRIFIVYVTPGSKQPFVSTIVDTASALPPAPESTQ